MAVTNCPYWNGDSFGGLDVIAGNHDHPHAGFGLDAADNLDHLWTGLPTLTTPGGELADFYHWDSLNGIGFTDSWAPDYTNPTPDWPATDRSSPSRS